MAYPASRNPETGKLTLTVLRLRTKIGLAMCSAVLFGIAVLMLAVQAAYLAREGSRASVFLVADETVIALLALANAALVLLELLRIGAWLEGSELVVRTSFSKRRSDLAAAPVRLGSFFGRQCVIARDNLRGRVLRLMISRLTAPELVAVAAAIVSGGRQERDAWEVAATLRQLAAQRRVTLSAHSGYQAGGGYGTLVR
jgi:hypothetical protein